MTRRRFGVGAFGVTIACNALAPEAVLRDVGPGSRMDPDGGFDGGIAGVQLGGVASGVEGELVLGLADQQLTVSQDGSFRFDDLMLVGSVYEVTVTSHPPGQLCTVEEPAGVVTADSEEAVRVHCEDGDAPLLIVELSEGAMSPLVFAPDVARYRVDVPAWVDEVDVAVLPSWEGAGPHWVNGGEASGPFSEEEGGQELHSSLSLEPGTNRVELRASARNGEFRSWIFEFHRASTVRVEAAGKVELPQVQEKAGYAVAVDRGWLAVGAPGNPTSGRGMNTAGRGSDAPDSGAVYLFRREPQGWVQRGLVKAPNADPGDRFGISVALRDGLLVVGAEAESSSSSGVAVVSNTQRGTNTEGPRAGLLSSNALPSSGAVYVYELVDTEDVWGLTAYVKAEFPGQGEFFGHSVATDGKRIAVGAYQEAGAGLGVNPGRAGAGVPSSGAVYLYDKDSSGWFQSAYLKASNTGAGDRFGASVAVYGQRLLVGAPHESGDVAGLDGQQDRDELLRAGAAYMFAMDPTQGDWFQEAYIKPHNLHADMRFGSSVSLLKAWAAVGAHTEGGGGAGVYPDGPEPVEQQAPESGAVYLYQLGEQWQQAAYLKASNASEGDRFGHQVRLSGRTLLVGASLEAGQQSSLGTSGANGAPGAGALYVFSRRGDNWRQRRYLKASNTEPGDNFGFAFDYDGRQLVVGAPFEDSAVGGFSDRGSGNNAAPNAGAFYVLE